MTSRKPKLLNVSVSCPTLSVKEKPEIKENIMQLQSQWATNTLKLLLLKEELATANNELQKLKDRFDEIEEEERHVIEEINNLKELQISITETTDGICRFLELESILNSDLDCKVRAERVIKLVNS